MASELMSSGTVVAGGALAGWLSGRQFANAQLQGMPAGPPGLSRGLLVGGALALAGYFDVGGSSVSAKALELGEGALAAEVGRMAFQRGAASMAPTAKVQGIGGRQQKPSLIGELLDGLRSLVPGNAPQQMSADAYNQAAFEQSLMRRAA